MLAHVAFDELYNAVSWKTLFGASSTTQNVIALSSGATSTDGSKLVRDWLSYKLLLKIFGFTLAAQEYVDSTACKEVASRRGVGQRHLHVQVLWVQSAAQEKRVTIHKVAGKENHADLGTKHLTAPAMLECLRRSGTWTIDHRAASCRKAYPAQCLEPADWDGYD